jgi:general secretion pathway protein J
VRIAQTTDDRGSLLVRSRAPFAPTDPEAPQSLPAVFADQVALLRGPYQVFFAYADREGAWRERWLNEDGLPTGVRFTIRDAVSQRSLAISTAAIVRVDVPAECAQQKSKRDCGKSSGNAPDKEQPGASKQQAPAAGG